MNNSIFSPERYEQMKHECKAIVQAFYEWCKQNRGTFNPLDENSDPEDCAVPDERIEQLYTDLSKAMNVDPTLGHFRDNDVEYGKYSENGNVVLLPYCINYEDEHRIATTICHELYHAFQYAAICSPADYPFLTSNTISRWRHEFNPANYENGDRDNKKYRDQDIEVTAREFAHEITM